MGEVKGDSLTVSTDAVLGTNAIPKGTAAGVHGVSKNSGPGVLGESIDGRGVQGISTNNYGVRAHSDKIAGLRASSAAASAIEGWGSKGNGVLGMSSEANGIHGTSETGLGVYGKSRDQQGVFGDSDKFDGVFGVSRDPKHAGVSGHNWDQNGNPNPGGLAGWFGGNVAVTGDVEVSGDIRLLNADFAEDFDVSDSAEPGEVMVLSDTGSLIQSTKPYDRKVVGVISGAGSYKPGIILDSQHTDANRKPVAMMGKVYCKVDADASPVETGDMLTTSDIAGYAMKATDPFKAFGAVIGKALVSLHKGKGMIPILVTLQ